MVTQKSINEIINLSQEYNDESFFEGDPIIFPKHFALVMQGKPGLFFTADGASTGKTTSDAIPSYIPTLKDVEIAGIIAAHLAWGRRDMIIRDCKRAFDEMNWQPFNYIMAGKYRNDDASLHRTVKWSEFANICANLKDFYSSNTTLEALDADQIRIKIYSQKSNPKAANKKIHMFRRWMVRNDGIVDLGLWKKTSPAELIIPLDVHVHRSATNLGITSRKGADITTAQEITDFLKTIFPDDPCKGDFALFAYAATKLREEEIANKHK